MEWNDLERAFGNAAARVLSRRKLVLTFIALCLCGVLTVFCRAVAIDATPWVSMSLVFLPILLSSGLLLSLGILLVRMYLHETKGLALSMGRLMAGSLDLMLGTTYLSLPPVLAYLILWIVLGFFFLLREIPLIGPFMNVIFAFAPFILIFSSILLCLVSVGLLFFIAPAAAHQSGRRIDLAKRVGVSIGARPMTAIVLFLAALIPALFVAFLLTLSATLTNTSFAVEGPSVALVMEWFFMMIPFAALLSPAVVFFFHFGAESYQILHRR